MENFVVTVGRQFGSMGRPIAKKVAEMLDISYYDRDIVEEVSRIYGYDNIQSKTYLSELKPLEVNKKRVLEHKIKNQKILKICLLFLSRCSIIIVDKF